MKKKQRIAIACQGGVSHTAFTAGVLKKLLAEGVHRKFDLVALSGTSGGARCATACLYGLLKEANGLLNVDERRKVFCKLEEIQMQRGSIGIPYWRNQWFVCRKRVRDVKGHPSLYMLFNKVWLKA